MWPRGTLSLSDSPLCLSGSHGGCEYQRTQIRATEQSLHSHNFPFRPKEGTFCCTPAVAAPHPSLLSSDAVPQDHPLSPVTLALEGHSHLARLWSCGPSAYLLPKQNHFRIILICLFGIDSNLNVESPREGEQWPCSLYYCSV